MTAIGYARVSTTEQSLDSQRSALTEAGAERIFEDVASGSRDDRPQLAACMSYLRPGDVLVVVRLDRLGRSIRHLIETVTALGERGVEFRSLSEGFDTSTSGGQLVFHVFAAVAQFERNLIRERTVVGLAQARGEGRVGGRPSVMDDDKVAAARAMRAQGASMRKIGRAIGVSASTVCRHLETPITVQS